MNIKNKYIYSGLLELRENTLKLQCKKSGAYSWVIENIFKIKYFVSKLYIRNVKTGWGNLNKISYRNVGAENQRWNSRARCWVQWLKARLESLLPAWISSNPEFADMHFIYTTAEGNWAAAQSMLYIEWFLCRNSPDCGTLKRLHWKFCASGLFYASSNDTDTERYRRILAVEEAVLCTVDDSLLTSS